MAKGDSDVGYGKPPQHAQFKPGQSGNPSGRPRGSQNMASIVLREARKPIRINGPRGARTVNKMEAALMQLANQAAQGNLAAQRQFWALLRSAEDSLSGEHAPSTLEETDHLVMQSILQRFQQSSLPAKTTTSTPKDGKDDE